MPNRNPHFAKLEGYYLFQDIYRRKMEFLKTHPEAKLLNLGIGDTTEPLAPYIAKQLSLMVQKMGTKEGYKGYGPEQGEETLRNKLVEKFYSGRVSPDEVFISDGTKCDIGRLQVLWGSDAKIAVQDPTYPVYVDTGVALGQTGPRQKGLYEGIIYLPCLPKNNFFPELDSLPPIDILYFCSPNNPTGAVATHDQLKKLIHLAKKDGFIVVFDAAYSSYIQDSRLPKSIYEIEGAKEVAIELGSFSKMAGFTGIRLGWSIIPHQIVYKRGENLHHDWRRMHATFFNGASIISQAGGIAALEEEGFRQINSQVAFYLENARLLREALIEKGIEVYGGEHAPYLWASFPHMGSWDAFHTLLEKVEIVTTPGAGFGPSGEGFVRLSAYGSREHILEAIDRLRAIP